MVIDLINEMCGLLWDLRASYYLPSPNITVLVCVMLSLHAFQCVRHHVSK